MSDSLGTARPRSARARARPGTARDQRARLLEAITAIVGQRGFAAAKVGDIAARAGVSRATFYEHFADKEHCFAAAHERLASRLGTELQSQIARAEPPRAAHAAIAAITELGAQHPELLNALTHEALIAGDRTRAQHDELLAGLALSIEHALAYAREQDAGQAPEVPAVPIRVLLGGAFRLCCLDARRHGRVRPQLAEVLARWIDSYACSQRPSERASRYPRAQSASAGRSAVRRSSPPVLPRGRHRLPREFVDAIQRERLAHAAAEVASRRHAGAVAVSEIVAAAGVSREVFYAHFADKEQALLAAHVFVFEQLIAAASSAFFAPGMPWPERIWEAGSAFTALLAANPTLTHFAFVCSYSIGGETVGRIDETALALGLFLEEGRRSLPHPAALPHAVSDAIALAVVEGVAHEARHGRSELLPALKPPLVYVALAPFIGPAAARELVARKAAEARDALTATVRARS